MELLGQGGSHQQISQIGYDAHERHFCKCSFRGNLGIDSVFPGRGSGQQAPDESLYGGKALRAMMPSEKATAKYPRPIGIPSRTPQTNGDGRFVAGFFLDLLISDFISDCKVIKLRDSLCSSFTSFHYFCQL